MIKDIPIQKEMDEWIYAKHMALQSIGISLDCLPDPKKWVEVEDSKARFHHTHFNGNKSFELPFNPKDFIWSPITLKTPVNLNSHIKGHYKRGVNKYINALRRGEILPPIIFIWRFRSWSMQDGCHRYDAHVKLGKNNINTIFAYPKYLLSEI